MIQKPAGDKQRTSDKFRWLDQVGADSELTPLCFRLAYAIASYVNRATGDAWPGQRRLAQECHVSERAIRDALILLRARNHLDVTPGTGRGITSRYRPTLWGGAEMRKLTSTIKPQKAEPDFHDSSAEGGSSVPERWQKTTEKGGSTLPTIPFIEPREEPIDRKSLMTITKSDFETWWTAFPRKVAKTKAEKIYTGIIKSKRATADELLAGATRYAAERAGQDQTYTQHPATWLNSGCWLDEPRAPVRSSSKPNQADTAIDGMRRYLDRDRT